MKNKFHIIYILCALFISSTISSCKHKEDDYHNIKDAIEAESKNYDGISISSEDIIDDINLMEITEGTHTFLIPERKSQIKSYACTECHSKDLDKMQNLKDGKKAHWDISINHADEKTMNCTTCHNGSNLDNLTSITGESIDFNNSYLMCSQCHTRQFEDWKGGAHGKQIESWAPPRTSMTCVNCHNPHDPHIESKWPSRYNTQKIKERE